MRDSLKGVYSFSNLADVFSKDAPVVKKLVNAITDDKNDGRRRFNFEKSRTKEMNLRWLEADLQDYLNRLQR